jgi:hypothetical protein
MSGSNAGHTMFRGSVKGTGYPLHSPVSPFTSPPVRHRVPSHFNFTLQYSLPDHEHVMFELCRRQEDLDQKNNLKSVHFVRSHYVTVYHDARYKRTQIFPVKWRVTSHLLFSDIIRSSPYSPH